MENNFNAVMTSILTALKNCTEKELDALQASVQTEKERRAAERTKKRQTWISTNVYRLLAEPHVACEVIGSTTVVAIYDRTYGLRMGTATPVKGDTYDSNTGLAVAYAKAQKIEIPDYI